MIQTNVDKRGVTNIRNKPFIVICGCTGTGKTKLSIQLAEWLNVSGRTCEIINADAMQLFKNLDIITNKATTDEMKGIKHHLIGYLESTNILNNVIDYRQKAVNIIDQMLQEDKVPILVGGTHYYIQSVIWDILIDKDSKTESNDETRKRKIDLNENDSPVIKLIMECLNEESDDLNVRLHDSDIKNEDIYEQLRLVDPQSALKIHPNDRRKLIRALQIYYTHGVTKTELLKLKNNTDNDFQAPIRYKNVCIFSLNCQAEILNKRLDDRVDQMISNGLYEEVLAFKKEFEDKFENQNIKDYSRNFEFGIFQSIGFKEFNEYFNYLDTIKDLETTSEIEQAKKNLFAKCVDEMKVSTRRYAKTQIKWVKNRFVKRANKFTPNIYELDTSDLDKWNENIFDKASKIFQEYLTNFENSDDKDAVDLNRQDGNKPAEEYFQFNKCEICDKVFINKYQWESHLIGKKHKSRIQGLKRKKEREEKQLC